MPIPDSAITTYTSGEHYVTELGLDWPPVVTTMKDGESHEDLAERHEARVEEVLRNG